MKNHESNMQIVNEKLTEDNVHAWKFRITNYLKGKGYWDYVESANEAPHIIPDIGASAEQVKSMKDWYQGSAKVMYWLSVSVSDSIVGHIQDADAPKDAWDNLIAFNATNTRARKIQLKNELNTIKRGDLSVNDYTLKIKVLYDLIIGGDALEDVEHVKALLHKQFDMKDLGELCYFLGIEMIRNEGDVWLSQKKYGLDMFMKYGMADCKPISTPLDQNLKWRIDEGEVLDDATMYRRIVGSLIYMTISRPDLSYAVGLVSQFVQLPRKPHLDAMRRIMRHVRATLDYALFYDAGGCCGGDLGAGGDFGDEVGLGEEGDLGEEGGWGEEGGEVGGVVVEIEGGVGSNCIFSKVLSSSCRGFLQLPSLGSSTGSLAFLFSTPLIFSRANWAARCSSRCFCL
ncbi:hypothetical protein L7F22_001832 [Adiantum nelumboides]|nr:hypothetical protein [Adiantum nelumboides]